MIQTNTASQDQSTFSSDRPSSPRTLLDVIEIQAERNPDATAFEVLGDSGEIAASATNAALFARAQSIASVLSSLAAPGDRVILLFPSGLDFVEAFFGCICAGMVAVPAYPLDGARLTRTVARLEGIVTGSEAAIALTDAESFSQIAQLQESFPELRKPRWIASPAIEARSAVRWKRPDPSPGAPAVIQYTSGSTTAPRGVVLTHRNILENEKVLRDTYGYSSQTTFVGWVPLAHDLGLFSHVVLPVFAGAKSVLIRPDSFIRNPASWMRAVARYPHAATHAPNFAYELAARRTTPEELASLDLSVLETANFGGEPVRRETLQAFTNAFAPRGFNPKYFVSAYGLAEATLLVSSARNPRMIDANAAELERGRFVPVTSAAQSVRYLVSVGKPTPGQKIAIVDPDKNTEVAAGHVGEIWVHGPNVASGYWNKPEETRRTFEAFLEDTGEGPFLRTGDLGFLDRGELFITGRLKDIVILYGRTHYPQDFEFTAERSDRAFRPGCSAAFAVDTGTHERLVVVQEVRDPRLPNAPELVRKIRRALFEEHGVKAHTVVLAAPGAVPKTSSGKIQRRACRAAYQAGSLKIVHESGPESSPGRSRRALTEPETTLAAIWAQALQIPVSAIRAEDCFFDLGGDSLAASACLVRIQKAFGKPAAPLEIFLYAPSLEQMTNELLRDSAACPRKTEIVAIQPRGSGVPLVIVAPGIECRAIARRLGLDHPVLGIRGADLGGLASTPSIEEIAADYAEALARFTTSGRVALAGWCASGVVAFEMAKKLQKSGKNVDFIAIFDARGVHRPAAPFYVRASRALQHISFLISKIPTAGVAPLTAALRAKFLSRHAPASHDSRWISALTNWRPQPWPGRVLHIWAQDRPRGRFRDLQAEWGNLTPNHRFFEVPGDHLTMLHEPNVSHLARIIAGEMAEEEGFEPPSESPR